MFEEFIVAPTIPLWFTNEELETCKQYAFDALTEKYPHLRNKEVRMQLNPIQKIQVINALSQIFNTATKELEKSRGL